ncbi:MAG TPA: class I SAM-dependent methyltransferase [Caulobacteraceae bacterium]|jgi:SAM-dependent methyltransferase
MRGSLDITAGREAFGADPSGYQSARPPYPEALYARLCERTGLGRGAAVFEVGAGAGLATERLLAEGADPLLVIEPDARSAAFLRAAHPDPALRILNDTWESADLPADRYDLGVSATAFHWLEQGAALAKVRRSLRPGGWWAMWWTNFGVEDGPDAFEDATRPLFAATPRAPAHGRKGGPSFAMDRRVRLAEMAEAKLENGEVDFWPWTITLPTARLVALYATFSPIIALDDDSRRRLLSELGTIADRDFGGRVERSYSTILYTARRS